MRLFRLALRFLAIVCALYVLAILTLNSTKLDQRYNRVFVSLHEGMINSFFSDRTLQFERKKGSSIDFDLEVRMVNDEDIEKAKKKAKRQGKKNINVRNASVKYSLYSRGFLGTLFLIILFLATWLQWKKKWLFLLAALIIYDLFVVFDLCMGIGRAMQKHDFLRIFNRDSLGQDILQAYEKYFPGFSDITMLIALFIWLVWLLLFTEQREVLSQALRAKE